MDKYLEERIFILKKWIDNSNNIVFFGGAGVSTESGIPDFRSVDGLYNRKYEYPPEKILSHSFFMKKTNEFYRFYRDKMIVLGAKPNITHLRLAEWEKEKKLRAIVTQNIDGLHQQAGSNNVLELHGSIHRNYCIKCHKSYKIDDILQTKDVPICKCGGVIKPDVVLYEEALDETVINETLYYIKNAEVLIVGGTSLSVYPAAGMIEYYQGNKLVLINKSETPYDKNADLVLNCDLGEVFSKL